MPRYVKAAYDFDTTEAGEIALRAGDVVRVVRQVRCITKGLFTRTITISVSVSVSIKFTLYEWRRIV